MTSSQEMETYETPGAQTNARYLGGWYFCWLIEKRGPPTEWWGPNGFVSNANEALWFARQSDADEFASEINADVFVCEHGFQVSA